jgi:DNA-binding MarR family transcriptional regulator
MRRSERSRADPDIGVLTSRVTSALQRALQEALTGDGYGVIGPRHRAVLAQLDAEGSRAIDVSRLSGQHKQVVGTLVDELEQLGYVRRAADPSDRRAKLIVPTESGLRLMSKIDALTAEIERDLATALGEGTYRDFKRSFQRVADLLGERD